MKDEGVPAEPDTIFEMLANDHRRRLLFALLEHNPQQEVQEPDGFSLNSIEQEQLKVEMLHMHLPKLEDVDYIRWDRDSHQVRKGPAFETMRPLLELLRSHPDTLLGESSTDIFPE